MKITIRNKSATLTLKICDPEIVGEAKKLTINALGEYVHELANEIFSEAYDLNIDLEESDFDEAKLQKVTECTKRLEAAKANPKNHEGIEGIILDGIIATMDKYYSSCTPATRDTVE